MARVRRSSTADAAIDPLRETRSPAPIPAPHFLAKRLPTVAAIESPLREDIEALGKQLSTISQAMLGSSQRATEREAIYAQAADQLLDTQQKLVSQLEAVVDHVQTLKENETPIQKPRAIA